MWTFKANLKLNFNETAKAIDYISTIVTNCSFVFGDQIINSPIQSSDVVATLYDHQTAVTVLLEVTLDNSISNYTVMCGHLEEKFIFAYPGGMYFFFLVSHNFFKTRQNVLSTLQSTKQ